MYELECIDGWIDWQLQFHINDDNHLRFSCFVLLIARRTISCIDEDSLRVIKVGTLMDTTQFCVISSKRQQLPENLYATFFFASFTSISLSKLYLFLYFLGNYKIDKIP